MPMIAGETTNIETVQKRRDVRIVAIPVVALDTTPEGPDRWFGGQIVTQLLVQIVTFKFFLVHGSATHSPSGSGLFWLPGDSISYLRSYTTDPKHFFVGAVQRDERRR